MAQKRFKYIYGPVGSWRLGLSLGVDLISAKDKPCPFDCIYCQIGRTECLTTRRKVFVPTQEIIKEIKALPKVKIDFITFSGRGEPTLAKNLGQAIKAVKRLRKEPVAVLSNAALLYRQDVRRDLSLADFVILKLDADSQKMLEQINRPAKSIRFSALLRHMKQFRRQYRGRLALQIMFMEKNRSLAQNLAKLAAEIQADEIQINTPRRKCAVSPLSEAEILAIKRNFCGMNVFSVYEVKRKKVKPISITDTRYRRGKL